MSYYTVLPKNLKISYDWRGMPVEFRMESKSGNVLENTRSCSRDSVRVLMAYDGSGRRVSKTRERKERDDETELNFFGARYLDPMLGLWISVDPARQFSSPYLYAGNGVSPIVVVDPDGNVAVEDISIE
ncbi:RHS repeat-associated protein [Fibrobacter sp. UWR4]|nr:RHS repeat-associated protein [Fibrobacter sp. UWR4]PZW72031.1 RHS repeat-associated protein [Fibrobacter sp. UWR1]